MAHCVAVSPAGGCTRALTGASASPSAGQAVGPVGDPLDRHRPGTPASPSALPFSRASSRKLRQLAVDLAAARRFVDHEIDTRCSIPPAAAARPAADRRTAGRGARVRRSSGVDLVRQGGEPLAAQAAQCAGRADIAGDARQRPVAAGGILLGAADWSSAPGGPGSFSGNPCGSIGMRQQILVLGQSRAATSSFAGFWAYGEIASVTPPGSSTDRVLTVRLIQADARQQQPDPRPPRAAVEPGGVDLHRHRGRPARCVAGRSPSVPATGSSSAGSGSAIGPGVSAPGCACPAQPRLPLPAATAWRAAQLRAAPATWFGGGVWRRTWLAVPVAAQEAAASRRRRPAAARRRSQNTPRPRHPATSNPKRRPARTSQRPANAANSVGGRRGSVPPSPSPAPPPAATGSRYRQASPDRTSGSPPVACPGSPWRSAADRFAAARRVLRRAALRSSGYGSGRPHAPARTAAAPRAISCTGTSGLMPSPWIERPDGV